MAKRLNPKRQGHIHHHTRFDNSRWFHLSIINVVSQHNYNIYLRPDDHVIYELLQSDPT